MIKDQLIMNISHQNLIQIFSLVKNRIPTKTENRISNANEYFIERFRLTMLKNSNMIFAHDYMIAEHI